MIANTVIDRRARSSQDLLYQVPEPLRAVPINLAAKPNKHLFLGCMRAHTNAHACLHTDRTGLREHRPLPRFVCLK